MKTKGNSKGGHHGCYSKPLASAPARRTYSTNTPVEPPRTLDREGLVGRNPWARGSAYDTVNKAKGKGVS